MKFETTGDHAASRPKPGQATSMAGPYETRKQAATTAADVCERARHSPRRGVMAEANLALLADACNHAGVTLGAYDARILEWLAGLEPDTCAVVAGLITRAHAAGKGARNRARPLLDPYCEAGQHANCPSRLCQCPECQHRLEWA